MTSFFKPLKSAAKMLTSGAKQHKPVDTELSARQWLNTHYTQGTRLHAALDNRLFGGTYSNYEPVGLATPEFQKVVRRLVASKEFSELRHSFPSEQTRVIASALQSYSDNSIQSLSQFVELVDAIEPSGSFSSPRC